MTATENGDRLHFLALGLHPSKREATKCSLSPFWVACVVALGLGCSAQAAEPEAAAVEPVSSGELFSGLCVPLNATDVLAPEASFRVAGWNSNWGQLKVMDLAKDGEEVKQGTVIARFEFIGKDALRFIQERIAEADAAQAQARITAEQTVENLQVEQRRLILEAKLAAVDIQKAPAVSRRQASLFEIRHRIAQFEEEAVRQRVASAIRTRDADLAFQDQTVSRAHQDMGRYTFYERRFSVSAAHDGVVRHAFHARERRKVQKGDSIGPGQKLLSVAKDATLGARFFVPEHRIHELKEGMPVVVISASSGEEIPAVIKRIDFFPQELGFLMELPSMPDAREKAFAVLAEFEGVPPGLSAGNELKVKGVR